jgi:hypothetical protein
MILRFFDSLLEIKALFLDSGRHFLFTKTGPPIMT